MKPANGFGLPGELVLAHKRPLIGKRDPELPDIGQICPVHGIESEPQCPLAVRRFFPRSRATSFLRSSARADAQPAGQETASALSAQSVCNRSSYHPRDRSGFTVPHGTESRLTLI